MADTKHRPIRTFDLFCGVGGSSHGARTAGATIVGGLDMWSTAIDGFALAFPKAKTYRTKAGAIAVSRILREVGKVDLLIASPECTSHSIAKGKRRGREDSRATAFEVIRFARVLKPRWIVVENVLQMRQWRRFDEWFAKLHALGYNTAIGVLDSQFFGTPQSRRRLFIVADLKSQPSLPARRRGAAKSVASVISCGEPKRSPWQFSPVARPDRAQATLDRAKRARLELGERLPYIMVYYGTDGAGGFQKLSRPLRTVTTVDRFALVRRRANADEMRMLQPSELSAAMGFPRSLRWPTQNRRAQIKLIGNAVCPRVMSAIVRRLVKPATE